MPRRSILSASEKQSLIALPDNQAEFIRCYSLSEADISIIKQRRGDANRLGFAIQLCYMRYPGIVLGPNESPDSDLLNFTSQQLGITQDSWNDYSFREKTRREHILELQQLFGFISYAHLNDEQYVNYLTTLAIDTDKGVILAEHLISYLRSQRILLPAINAIEQICAEAITQANKTIYSRLTDDLSQNHVEKLDALLQIRNGTNLTNLGWLCQSPLKPNSRHMLSHIDRLQYCLDINLPDGIERRIHQNRLLKIAREGGQMQAADLAKFESKRRYATLVALVSESKATIIDEIIDLHDRIIGKIFNKAKNKHQQVFSASGKSINEKVELYTRIGKALIQAKQQNIDPFDAIENIISWEAFTQSVDDAESLVQPNDFDFLPRINDSYQTIRRYAPAMLDILPLQATSSSNSLMQAIEVLRTMNKAESRKLPDNPPTKFIKKRWHKLIHTDNDIDVRYYELCVLSELKNALRSGDI